MVKTRVSPVLSVIGSIVDAALAIGQAGLSVFFKFPPGRLVEQSHLYQYLVGWGWTVYMVYFQKRMMTHLEELDLVGGPVAGLTAIVTGPTSGIGKETAAALARRGVKVVLACRNIAKGKELAADIERSCTARGLAKPSLDVRVLDLASLASVRAFSAQWESERLPVHMLINNAGIYAMGAPREATPDGFESHMGANHLGHFLLTLSLLPSLERGAAVQPSFGARVVNVSSSVHLVAHTGIDVANPHLSKPGTYGSEAAYANSKLAQILFTRELRQRLRAAGSPVQAFALHPGMVLTEVTRSLPPWVQYANRVIMSALLLTPAEGARASVYCATAPSAHQEAEASHGYFNANARPLLPSKAAQDPAAALWLWRWSAQQVQLPAELDLAEAHVATNTNGR